MRTFGVFAKKPVIGAVKTRLAADTTSEWASDVAAAMFADTLDRVAPVDAQRVIAFAPSDARQWFETAANGRFGIELQADGDLGRRLQLFFERQIAGGADAIVAIGTDSPTLPVAFIEQAFHLLESHDVVLGPAQDGGYYLIGCGRRLPPVFDGITWGTADVLAQTARRLDNPAWRLALLPPWYDIDTLDDWRMLCGHLAAMRRAGIDPGVPQTEALANPIAKRASS
jgi:rSAM/selenodomain-associated transferase 1